MCIVWIILLQDIQDIDPDEIMMKQLKQMEKQRKDLVVKLKQQEKKVCDIGIT